MIGLTSFRLSRLPHGRAFLDDQRSRWLPPLSRAACDVVAGWGMKPSGLRARKLAAARGVPMLLLEDGFLRSVGRGEPALSIVADDLGIYYDAGAPSRLERLIAAPLGAEQVSRARAVMRAWREGRVSKYNHARDYGRALPERYVLVVDQTFGDASIRHGGADETSFARMVEAALAENEDCAVLVKTHPDVVTRRKRGYFDLARLASVPRVTVVADDCHPARLIEHAEKVYAVTSQMGFEALVWGAEVRCFGMPFYAGWGLTRDEAAAPSRRGRASLEQLVHAALVAYPRYVDPETGQRCEVERVIEHVRLQRVMRARFPEEVHAVGFSRWKRPILRRFMGGSRVRFARGEADVPAGATLAVWGSAPVAGKHAKVVRAEDGFLRSVGLGADFTQPLSWVQDAHGIYYDATRPSALELLLQETRFEPGLVERAARLRALITEFEITKYNVGAVRWSRPKTDKKIILVPGQVESDASIRLGTKNICTNAALLRAAREAAPQAHIVYKPHPDVMAGLRAGKHGEHATYALADEVVTNSSIAPMLPLVDEVHTMTSLVGFEALMRGVKVVCYGQPFYAGWGLTRDMVPPERRKRRLALDELVAATLILYPAYISRTTGQFTTPENAVRELVEWRRQSAASGREPTVRRVLARVAGAFKERGRRYARP